MKLGIITAMGSEYDQLAQLLADKVEQNEGRHQYITGHLGDNELVLMQCGIGKVNAAAGTADLIHAHHPDCIISTGVAGGIDKCLKVMEVVVSSRIVYHDVWCGEGNAYGQVQGLPLYFEGNRTLLDCALGLASETRIHDGLICTGDKFITDRTELNEIKKQFPDGLAVDMESGAIAHVCYLNKISFISFRIISDTPGVKDHYKQYLNFWEEAPKRSFEMIKVLITALSEE